MSRAMSISIPKLLSLSATSSGRRLTSSINSIQSSGTPLMADQQVGNGLPRIRTRQLPEFDPSLYEEMTLPFVEPPMMTIFNGMLPYSVDWNLENYRRGYALDYVIMSTRDDFSDTIGYRTAAEAAVENQSAALQKNMTQSWWVGQGLLTVESNKIGQNSVSGTVYPANVTAKPQLSCVVKRMSIAGTAFKFLSGLENMIQLTILTQKETGLASLESKCSAFSDYFVQVHDHSGDFLINVWSGAKWLGNYQTNTQQLRRAIDPIKQSPNWRQRVLVIYHWLRVAFINLQTHLYQYALSPIMDHNINDLIMSKMLSDCVKLQWTDGFLSMYGASLELMAVSQPNRQGELSSHPVINMSLLFERANAALEDIVDRTLRSKNTGPMSAQLAIEKQALFEIEQFVSGFQQIIISLCLVQYHLGFVHEDLHLGNIMIMDTDVDYYVYRIKIRDDDDQPMLIHVPTYGKRWVIIDPGLSRGSIKDLNPSDGGVSTFMNNTMLTNEAAYTITARQPITKEAYEPTVKSIEQRKNMSRNPQTFVHMSKSETFMEKHADRQVQQTLMWKKGTYYLETLQRSCETDLYRWLWIMHQYIMKGYDRLNKEWLDQIATLKDAQLVAPLSAFDAIALNMMEHIMDSIGGFSTTGRVPEYMMNNAYGVPEFDPYHHLFEVMIPLHNQYVPVIADDAVVKTFDVLLGDRTLVGTHSSRSDVNMMMMI